DAAFARIELEMARDAGFKGIVALRGDQGLALARQYRPDAIVLDVLLPDMDGGAVLDALKRDARTRHIPVHIVSGVENRQDLLRAGAVAFIGKPVAKEELERAFADIGQFIERRVKSLLVVEDDEEQRA